MTSIARLAISVESRETDRATRDLRDLERQSARTERRVDRLGAEARQSGRQMRSMGQESRALSAGLRLAATAGAAFLAAISVRQLVRTGDSFTMLRGRISLFTESAEETERVIAGLGEAAFRLGAQFNGLAELYARLALSQDELGVSQEQLLTITEGVNTAFMLTGATASEASAAARQLAQAFGRGALRGDELVSVTENAPILMQAFARALGVTSGEVTALAHEGAITAEVMRDALLASAEDFRAALDLLPETVDRASTALGGELRMALVELNKELRVTQGIAGLLRNIATDLRGQRIGLQIAEGNEEALRRQLELVGELAGEISRFQQEGFSSIGLRALENEVRTVLGNETVQAIKEAQEQGEGWALGYTNALIEALRGRAEDIREALRDVSTAAGGGEASDGGGRGAQAAEKEISLFEELAQAKARNFDIEQRRLEREAELREQNLRLMEGQLDHQIQLAQLRGDDDTLRMLERERDIRRDIQELMENGVSAAEARAIAERRAGERDTARRAGEFAGAVEGGIRAGFEAVRQTGDIEAFGIAMASSFVESALDNLIEQASQSLSNMIFGQAEAAAAGSAQGTAAALPMKTAITSGGATAASLMGSAIASAGAAAAAQMAAAAGGGSAVGGVVKSFAGAITGGAASIGGGKAGGGRVSAGTLYEVNEFRREVFRPDVGGTVIPLGREMLAPSGGGKAAPAPVHQHFHLHAEGAVMTAELMQSMEEQANQSAAQAYQAAIATSRNDLSQIRRRQSRRPGR